MASTVIETDELRYDGRSKSAQAVLACGLPGVTLELWIVEADTLALSSRGGELSLHKR